MTRSAMLTVLWLSLQFRSTRFPPSRDGSELQGWRARVGTTLAGFPGKRLSFPWGAMKDAGYGSLPAAAQKDLMPTINRVVETFKPGRDQTP